MNPITPKILENNWVKLVPLEEAHREPLHEAVQQTSHAMWTYMMKDALADFDGWFDDIKADQKAGNRVVFVVFDTTTGNTVGTSSLMNMDYKHNKLEIGNTWYTPSVQGTAINPATKLAVMAYAFEEAGCNRFEIKCDSLNTRSRRAILKLGAKEEGILRQHMQVSDHKGSYRYRDTAYHSILASEWPGVKQQLEQRLASYNSSSKATKTALATA